MLMTFQSILIYIVPSKIETPYAVRSHLLPVPQVGHHVYAEASIGYEPADLTVHPPKKRSRVG